LTIIAGTTTEETTYAFQVAGEDVTYTAAIGEDQDTIAAGLKTAIDAAITASGVANFASGTVDTSGSNATLTLTNSAAAGAGDVTLTQPAVTAGGSAAGGLAALSTIDVGTEAGAVAGLAAIDALIQTGIDATAAFGSKQKRIDNQNEFITTLSDSLKTGIGAMTDANLEEASARLQSLQVQQQLGTQALSIANQAPQSLLSLFR
jgi:flagellin